MDLNSQVRDYWESEPCGTGPAVTRELEKGTREWFERVEENRYTLEPLIHAVAQFTRHRGQRILEIGVGAGTDHLQWARAGCECHGVDMTEAAVSLTRNRLDLYGFHSELKRLDAEDLPYEDDFFDGVYSWGVIHHSEDPQRVIREVHRVLRPGGWFIGMMYNRHSVRALKCWIRHALLTGKPWRPFRQVIWEHEESIGTKAYTVREHRALLQAFTSSTIEPMLTVYDTQGVPACVKWLLPERWGWFVTFHNVK
jgi:ubiquinone/menaquinone biosynthesis C-methylase UbiE